MGVLRAVVAVPVRDEAERIAACLDALEAQVDIDDRAFGILLFLNNCSDGTEAVVAARQSARQLRIVQRTYPGAHAGWARREAMEGAAAWLAEEGAADGVVLTTDADSRVPPDWVASNLAAIDSGADAVAGRIALDPAESARLPAALHARGRLEGRYEALLTEIAALLDPVPHDPWPCHRTASGASFAVRADVYARVGGLPAVPVGEDRAFERRLIEAGARLRHAPEILVVTSGRLDGRAPGGAADTMRLRCEEPDSPCDLALEPVWRVLARHAGHRRIQEPGPPPGDLAVADPGTASGEAGRTIAPPAMGPERRPLRPSGLALQIRLAQAVVLVLRSAARLRDWWRAARTWSARAPGRVGSGMVGTSGSDAVGQHGTS